MMKDERIDQAINKIRSEMMIIILFGAAASFLVKTLVFNMGLMESITEYLILVLSPVYQFIRMHMMKISITNERGNKQPVKNLIMIIAVIVILSAAYILNAMKKSAAYNWQSPLIFLLIYFILFVSIFFITQKFNRNRGHKYEMEFDDGDSKS